MNMLDAELLRTFLAVDRAGGFTAAGRVLGLRQSTVSGHIARLEQAVGRELFRRDTRNLALTADGAAMVGFAHDILDAQAKADRYFSESQPTGLIRLGASDDLVGRMLSDVLVEFRQSYPGVDLELVVGLSENLKTRMAAGELDLMVAKRLPGEQPDRAGRYHEPRPAPAGGLVRARHVRRALSLAADRPGRPGVVA